MATLEEIQAKFDAAQRLETIEGGLAAFLSSMREYYGDASGRDFETWYGDIGQDVIFTYNELLEDEGLPLITQDDLRVLYEHSKENFRKNLRESHK
ncbi:MAG: hypothetical protein PHH00_03170 [Candidatus Nanoarchaeia archaeon]|nr:hypothetical protein [Candidatus Nanoarchaeia archaeon]